MINKAFWRSLFTLLPLLTNGASEAQTARFTPQYAVISPPASAVQMNGCSAPGQAYEISRFEVTNTEYAHFLNSVARRSDPYKLHSQLQEQHFWGGIVKRRDGKEFIYLVKPGYEKLPVTFVSWHDAIRYANWLHFGRPNTGSSEPKTTEGTDVIGAYDTRQFPNRPPGIKRNPNAIYYIPTCGEWILAGFFNPQLQKLTTYSTGDLAPRPAPPLAGEATANYYSSNWALPFPHLAPVDAYSNSISAQGTHNQAGNVMEWVETPLGKNQMALGGSLFLPADTLQLDYRDSELADKKLSSFGFRVARQVKPVEANTQIDFQANIASTAVEDRQADEPLPSTVAPNWTRIEHPGNISDYRSGAGCVPYSFEISRTEITNSQYVKFLNAVAQKSDIHRLFLEDMSTGVAGGILSSTVAGQHTYSVKPDFENRPASYLSWFTLARYANWMHFEQPAGEQVLGVTEGDRQQGAYDTTEFDKFELNGRNTVAPAGLFMRNPNAKYFIPNNDEWYKAAYYDPERPGGRKYWSYPGRSDSPPTNEARSASAANYQISTLGEGGPFFVSSSGSFRSKGYYDVVDMGGNLWEWLETWRGLGGEKCWRCDIPNKGLRGGSFNYIDIGLSYSNIDPGFPSDHYFVYGGRLARRLAADEASTGWCTSPELRASVVSARNRVMDKRKSLTAVALLIIAAPLGWLIWRRSAPSGVRGRHQKLDLSATVRAACGRSPSARTPGEQTGANLRGLASRRSSARTIAGTAAEYAWELSPGAAR